MLTRRGLRSRLLMTGIQYARDRFMRQPPWISKAALARMPRIKSEIAGRISLRRPQLAGAQAAPASLDQWPKQRDQPEGHDRADQPVGEEHAEAALRRQQ